MLLTLQTGTLTKNEMTAVNVRTATNLFKVTGVGYAPVGDIFVDAADGTPSAADTPVHAAQQEALKQLLQGAVLCNDSALTKTGVEVAIDLAGVSQGGDKASGRSFTKVKPAATHKVTYQPMGAPTEVALLTLGEKLGLQQKDLRATYPRIASVPFESEHKFM